MAAGWAQIATQTIRGKGSRVWTVSIDRYYDDTSAAPASISPRFERVLKLTYGDQSDMGWPSWRLPSFLTVRIRDDGGEILGHLTQEIDDRRFRLILLDSLNQFAWRGFLRRSALRRPLVTGVRAPFLDLAFTDGLGTLGDLPPVETSSSFRSLHGIVSDVLYTGLLDLPIQYAQAWRPSNAAAGPYMDLVEIRTPIPLLSSSASGATRRSNVPGGRRRLFRQASEQIEDIATAFNARVYQGLRRNANGTSQWWFQQRFLTGRAVSLISGAAQFFDGTTLTVNSITSDTITLLDEEIDAATGQIAPLPRTTFVTVTRDLSHLGQSFLGRDRYFQHWTNPPAPQLPQPKFWQTGGGAVRPYTFPSDHDYYPGEDGLDMDPFAYVQQAIGYVAQHDEIVLAIHAYNEPSNSIVVKSLGVRVWIEPFDDDEEPYYLEVESNQFSVYTATWTSVDTNEVFSAESTLRPVLISVEAIPVSGMLWVRFTGGSVAPHTSYLTNAGVTLHSKEALDRLADAETAADLGYEQEWQASFPVVVSGARVPGQTIAREHAWANLVDGSAARGAELYRVLQVTETGGGKNLIVSWLDETGATWYDLTGLEARDLLDQQSAGGDQIITRVRRITPPEARYQIGGAFYTLSSAEIDLIDEVSDCVFTPLTKSVEV